MASTNTKVIDPKNQLTLYSSSDKKFEELFIFVHFFAGNQKKLHRHIKLVNELGYDAYAFDLSFKPPFIYSKLPEFSNKQWKLRNIWSSEIKDVLDKVQGPKILFSFSGPSACSIDVVSHRKENDILAMISDSGPFTDLYWCNVNMAKENYNLKSKFSSHSFALFCTFGWDIYHTKNLVTNLKNLPKGLKYLSIRGVQDPIVPLKYIDKLFKYPHSLKLTILNIETGGHLDSLKKEAEKYKSELIQFLSHI